MGKASNDSLCSCVGDGNFWQVSWWLSPSLVAVWFARLPPCLGLPGCPSTRCHSEMIGTSDKGHG